MNSRLDGIYIHIPFCLSKCPYCSFHSAPWIGVGPQWYIDALIHQARLWARHPWVAGRQYGSLFIGGGTPTIYEGEDLARIIEHCRQLFPLTPDAEITVETNPNTVTEASLRQLRAAGVNRLSMGVQTFDDRLLRAIGRSHTRAAARAAARVARAAGFTNRSLDLMYGLPGQAVRDVVSSLETAISLEPEHISLYELMVEEGTPFAVAAARGELDLPAEDTVLAMEAAAYALLARHGYQRYEISNFSRPGFSCRHNLNYWHNGSYLGLGAGAVSAIEGLRVKNVTDPLAFRDLVAVGLHPVVEAECLDPAARFRETVILGLRMTAGLDLAGLEARFGLAARTYYGQILEDLVRQDLLAIEAGFLRLTAKGLPVANQVLARLV